MKIRCGSMLKLFATILVILLPGIALAQAQPSDTSLEPDSTGEAVQSEWQASNPVPDSIAMLLRSEDTAFKRSLAGTLLPLPTLALAIPGLIVGPSVGYFYGNLASRAWTGIGLRLAGLGGMASSFAICGWDCGPGDSDYRLAWWVFVPSAALLVGSAIYDVATVKQAVRHRNEALLGPKWSVTPVYFPETKTIGLRLTLGI